MGTYQNRERFSETVDQILDFDENSIAILVLCLVIVILVVHQ